MLGATHRLAIFLVKLVLCQHSVLLKSDDHVTSPIPFASSLFNGTFVRMLGLLHSKGIILGYAFQVRIVAIIVLPNGVR